jgi:hypothetical protein
MFQASAYLKEIIPKTPVSFHTILLIFQVVERVTPDMNEVTRKHICLINLGRLRPIKTNKIAMENGC